MVEAESALDTKRVLPYPPIVGTEKPPYKSYGIFQVIPVIHHVFK